MLNHVKTLLLNEDPANANAGGCCFIVDTSFNKVNIVGDFLDLHKRIFDGASNVEDRSKIVNAAFELMNHLDLREFTCFFDGRQSGCCSNMPGSDFRRIFFLFLKSDVGFLFDKANTPDVDELLEKLKCIYYSGTDGVIKVAASIMAFVLQLEALRRKRGV